MASRARSRSSSRSAATLAAAFLGSRAMSSRISTASQPLGDPKGMRPSTDRPEIPQGLIGVHPLADGRDAWCTWLPHSQTHVHVVVWVPGDTDFETVENIARVNAAGVTEKLM